MPIPERPLPAVDDDARLSRRGFLLHGGAPAIVGALVPTLWQASAAAASTGGQQAPSGSSPGPIELPPMMAESERQTPPPELPWPPSERVGLAVVGLGRLTVERLLPALASCKKVKLAGLVSGSPDKARRLAAAYGLAPDQVYDYQGYDRIKDDRRIDAVYIVLPNSMHAEFTVRAAAAGKHVLCEKPMANTMRECEQMIAACERAKRALMIAYRIQYEPRNRLAKDMVRGRQMGQVKLIEAVNVQRQGTADQWRLKRALAGGGALPDIGLYCLNTTRYLLGEEPEEVQAMAYSTPGDPRFAEVEENVAFQLRFPSGVLSNHLTGYDQHEAKRYRVYATEGWFGLDPAFAYEGLRFEQSHAEGPLVRKQEVRTAEKDQFALEMDHFGECVKTGRRPYTPGEEGLQDQRVMDAIYEAARTSRAVKLEVPKGLDVFRGPAPDARG